MSATLSVLAQWSVVGTYVGVGVGSLEGLALGLVDGLALGETLGIPLGLALGETLGLVEGLAEGRAEGLTLGLALGLVVGLAEGLVLGNSSSRHTSLTQSPSRSRWSTPGLSTHVFNGSNSGSEAGPVHCGPWYQVTVLGLVTFLDG